MSDKSLCVLLVLVASLAVVHSIGFGDLTKVYQLLKDGVEATCVEIPEFVGKYVIPLKCVKCENDRWTFNGTLGVQTLKQCFSAADAVGINIVGLLASIAVSLFYCIR